MSLIEYLMCFLEAMIQLIILILKNQNKPFDYPTLVTRDLETSTCFWIDLWSQIIELSLGIQRMSGKMSKNACWLENSFKLRKSLLFGIHELLNLMPVSMYGKLCNRRLFLIKDCSNFPLFIVRNRNHQLFIGSYFDEWWTWIRVCLVSSYQ